MGSWDVTILVTCRAWCGASLSCRMCGNLTTWCFFTVISEGMSTLVTRGEEVKLKCNYNVRGRGEHRNLER